MTGNDPLPAVHAAPAHGRTAADEQRWARQWQQVPPSWRTLTYHLDRGPANTVFQPNPRYLPTAHGHDFTPEGVQQRICDEMAWWVWLCGHEDRRKVEPSLLKWTSRAVSLAAADYHRSYYRGPVSIAELSAEAVVRHGVLEFERRNGRLPSAGFRRNVTSFIEHLHLHVAVRCTEAPWWAHDIWDLDADPRIPQREHEPCHDQVVRLGAIQPVWLREGVRFWLRTALTAELLRWSSVMSRTRDITRHLGPFLADRHIDDPVLRTDRAELRLLFTEFTDYLKSPAARAKPDRPLSSTAIAVEDSPRPRCSTRSWSITPRKPPRPPANPAGHS